MGDPKSYNPTSLLCVSLKILETLIYARVGPIIDSVLPHEQAGFRPGKLTIDQVTCWRITLKIALWLRRPGLCLLISQQPTTRYGMATTPVIAAWLAHGPLIMELVANCCFTLTTGSKKRSRVQRLKNGVTQGSVLTPIFFQHLILWPANHVSRKYAYADYLATMHADMDCQSVERMLTKCMATVCKYLQAWKPKICTTQTVSAVFHLNNKEAKRELKDNFNKKSCPYVPRPNTSEQHWTWRSRILDTSTFFAKKWHHASHSWVGLLALAGVLGHQRCEQPPYPWSIQHQSTELLPGAAELTQASLTMSSMTLCELWLNACVLHQQTSSYPRGNPTCWASSKKSYTVCSTPCHGACTSSPLSVNLSMEWVCTKSQIDTRICTRRITTHQFIWGWQLQRSGLITDGMRSRCTTLRGSVLSSQTSAPTLLEWPCQ